MKLYAIYNLISLFKVAGSSYAIDED